MNRNYKEFNQIPKRNNTLNMNSRSNNNIPNQIMKRQQEEKNDLFTKKNNNFQDNNPNKRYLTPLPLRYQAQPYDNNQNFNFSRVPNDNNNKIQNENNNSNNDAFYYKNLYQQTKNNLNKEKQKNEDNQIINDNLNEENNMLKGKIENLTKQLDRLINLVEKSNSQNINNMKIKQEQIDKLKKQIELLKKNDSLEKRKALEEKESMANTIKQLNSSNQNTQLIIKNYENKIEQITLISNNEINKLKEQIISLNKNLTLCINEKTMNENKFQEIIAEMNQKLKSQNDIGKMLNMKNLENSKLVSELNGYKNNYKDIQLKYSNIELEMDTLKKMEKNYNKILEELEKAQNEKDENLQKLEISAKIVSELKSKLNQNLEELNNVKQQNEKLEKEKLVLRNQNKEKESGELNDIKKKLDIALKDIDIRNMKIKILEEAKNENKELKNKISAISKELNDCTLKKQIKL